MNAGAQRGFTLIEMMLAIALFALLSVAALAVFNGVLNNSEITQRRSSQMAQLQRALALIERDIGQAIVRTPRSFKTPPAGAEFAAGDEHDGYRLRLIRAPWPNPGARLPRSALERVAYRWHDGRLERLSYPGVDSPETTARRVLLLPEVTQFRLRFYYRGEWLAAWHAGETLPQAIEVALETPGSGPLRRVVLLTAGEAHE